MELQTVYALPCGLGVAPAAAAPAPLSCISCLVCDACVVCSICALWSAFGSCCVAGARVSIQMHIEAVYGFYGSLHSDQAAHTHIKEEAAWSPRIDGHALGGMAASGLRPTRSTGPAP